MINSAFNNHLENKKKQKQQNKTKKKQKKKKEKRKRNKNSRGKKKGILSFLQKEPLAEDQNLSHSYKISKPVSPNSSSPNANIQNEVEEM